MDKPSITLRTPSTPAELDAVRDIFREYASTLGVDLCFQGFDAELAQLPGDYAEPRGALLIAEVEGAVAGCCALRPLDTADYPNASEMKRLFVRKAFRGFGLGRELAEAMLDAEDKSVVLATRRVDSETGAYRFVLPTAPSQRAAFAVAPAGLAWNPYPDSAAQFTLRGMVPSLPTQAGTVNLSGDPVVRDFAF